MSLRSHIHHRISKNDIRRRLTERRNTLSPSPEPSSQFGLVAERTESLPADEMLVDQIEECQLSDAIISSHEAVEVESFEHDKDRDCMSISTAISTETATIQHAEKVNVGGGGGLPTPDSLSEQEFGMHSMHSSLQLDFGNKLSLGSTRNNSMARPKDNLNIPSHSGETDSGSIHSGTSVKVGDVDVNMDAKSALDRLLDDVAGASGHDNDSIMTQEVQKSYEQRIEITQVPQVHRAATDSDLLHTNDASNRVTCRTSTESILPPVPPKDNNIRAREQLVLERRRERRAENGLISPRNGGQGAQLGIGRLARKRSMSTGDAQNLAKQRSFNVGGDMEKLVEEDLLSQSIERELKKLDGANSQRKSVRTFNTFLLFC